MGSPKKMTAPKIDLRNSVTECAQSVKKENAGTFKYPHLNL
jgi:hypothetical protein